MNENTAAESTAPAKKGRKRGIIITAIIAVVVLVAAVIVPMVLSAQAHNSAYAAYTAAQKELAETQAAYAAAQESLAEAGEAALTDYTVSKALLDVAKTAPTFFDPQEALTALETELNELAELTLVIAEDGTVTVAVVDAPEAPAKGKTLTEASSTDALNAGTKVLTAADAKLADQVAALDGQTEAIKSATEELKAASLAVLAAGEKSGTAWVQPEKATADAKAAYAAALEAIKAANLTEESDLVALTKAYIDARNAVQASHDATVAAEQAAAAEAQRQAEEAARRAAQSQPRNGGSGSGGGYSGGGGSGGGSTGGGTPPKPGGSIGSGGPSDKLCWDAAAGGTTRCP